MAARPEQMHALDKAITHWEGLLGLPPNSTEILPVCETAF
jgi:citrate lyase beta subunit